MKVHIIASFSAFLMSFHKCFSQPTYESFKDLAIGWILTPGKKTVANIIRTLGTCARKSHDAYQDFFSKNKWNCDDVNKTLFSMLLMKLIPSGNKILLGGDDTLSKHCGKKIFGIGIFRDPVRSTAKHVSYTRAHNWVVLYLIFKVPILKNTYIAFPICSRLRPKQKTSKKKQKGRRVTPKTDQTMVDLMKEMVELVIGWIPGREFKLVTDGAYACLLGKLPEAVELVSKIRKDAKLFEPPAPHVPGLPGRPRKKGERLPSPEQVAQSNEIEWESITVTIYGKNVTLSYFTYQGLWYHVSKTDLIKILIVRDPKGHYEDHYYFTDDLDMPIKHMLEVIAARWSVEVANKEAKQMMGMEDPQARVEKAVKRQAPLAMMLLSLVKLWYFTEGYLIDQFQNQRDPWYLHKEGIPFSDMLRLLRYVSWNESIFEHSNLDPESQKILEPVIQLLSKVA